MTASWRNGIVTLIIGLAACGGEDERKAVRRADSAGAPAMPGMPGMPGMAHGGGMESARMMDELRAHMRAMTGVAADSLQRMVPVHRQLTANMLQQMDAEMRQMRMPGDTAWSALMDSVRQDLTRMPEVGADELPGVMEGHRARVERLMTQHATMMQAH